MKRALFIAAALAACARSGSPDAGAAPREQGSPAHPPAGEAIGAGLFIERNPNGSLTLSGTDRWGAPIDTTYESVEYFKAAVPVLQRSLSPEASQALASAASRL